MNGRVKLINGLDAARKAPSAEIRKLEGLFGNVAKGLKNDVNQENKIVLPESGIFDMKDLVFSDIGNLMLGLTYR